jgi:hypothetical protein
MQVVVNRRFAVIFNGSFESSKSAKIEELFAENGQWETRRSGINRANINHEETVVSANCLLGIAQRPAGTG